MTAPAPVRQPHVPLPGPLQTHADVEEGLRGDPKAQILTAVSHLLMGDVDMAQVHDWIDALRPLEQVVLASLLRRAWIKGVDDGRTEALEELDATVAFVPVVIP